MPCRDQSLRRPKERLFQSLDEVLTKADISKLLDDAKFFMARDAMHAGKYEDAVAGFAQLKTPFSSYHTAEVSLLHIQLDNHIARVLLFYIDK